MKHELILHKNLTDKQLLDIIRVKSKAWPFPFESQVMWIKENLGDEDLHLLLLKDNEPQAYLNLVKIELFKDGIKHDALGIANVCSYVKGRGTGTLLMEKVNHYIESENKIGLLFCKTNLTEFYTRNKWEIVNQSQLNLNVKKYNVSTLIYNCGEYEFISYTERLF